MGPSISHKKASLSLLNQRARICTWRVPHGYVYTYLFNQLIQPTTMCNACIWGHSENRRIQYSAMRFLLRVGRVCPTSGLVEETGWVVLIPDSAMRYLLRVGRVCPTSGLVEETGWVALFPDLFPVFQCCMCNIEKLRVGLGMRLGLGALFHDYKV